ncbi:MAG: hypothetical protein HRU20_00650 [Pseudomonadales bacterium]|nr:hypothetical protein [Pseudomonadales bacterium]
MNKSPLFTTALISSLGLFACSDDDHSDRIAAETAKQNDLIAQQIEQQNQVVNPQVIVHGMIVDAETSEPVQEATIQITIANKVVFEFTIAADGVFELPAMSANSDYEMLVTSPTDAFMPRALFASTKVNQIGTVYNDIGRFPVSTANTITFSVLEENTLEPISGLTFIGASSLGNSSASNYLNYQHTSTFNADTGQYSITVPEKINIQLSANMDLNNDGYSDFYSYYYYYNSTLLVNSFLLDAGESILLSSVNSSIPVPVGEVLENIDIRISVIDATGLSYKDIDLAYYSQDPKTLEQLEHLAVFDEASQQYVFSDVAITNSDLYIYQSSFVLDKTLYRSSNISLTPYLDNEEQLQYRISTLSNYYNTYSVDQELHLVFTPSTSNPDVELIYSNTELDSSKYNFEAFYSVPVDIEPEQIKLIKQYHVSVIRGDDDANDAVAAGSTQFTSGPEEIAITPRLTLNNTLLSVQPDAALSTGEYRYSVGEVIDKRNGVAIDLYYDTESFTIKNTEDFDINALRLDNNNYFTNGALITANNTNGEASTASNQSSRAILFIPTSVENLQNFKLTKTAYVRNGVQTSDFDTYEIVNNGNMYYSASTYHLYATAENETILGNISYRQSGTSLEDGKWYGIYSYTYLSDNIDSSAINNITFSYEYETRESKAEDGTLIPGNKFQGTITLDVL